MTASSRILCIDSSRRRLRGLADALRRAGFDVWTAKSVSNAMCLAPGLHFDVIVVDHHSSQARPEVWDCLSETQPSLPILVHSGAGKGPELCRHLRLVSNSTKPQNSELVLALLLLLLGDASGSKPRVPKIAAA
jgi:DNA-binding NtrC family response regulator